MTKRLIEYNLPLADISDASAREKNIRHGHPSTLHIWWARRPLASSRVTAFAALIDDSIPASGRLTQREAVKTPRRSIVRLRRSRMGGKMEQVGATVVLREACERKR